MIFNKCLTNVHFNRNFFCDNAIELQGLECIKICDSRFASVALGEHCSDAIAHSNVLSSARVGPRASSQRGIQNYNDE